MDKLNNNVEQRTKIAYTIILIIVFAICGIVLITSPYRTRQRFIIAQNALIQEILTENYIQHNEQDNDQNEATRNSTETQIDETIEATYEATQGNEPANGIEMLSNLPPEPQRRFNHSLIQNIYGIGVITIERINLHLPVADGVDEDTLRIAAGRVPQTAQIGEIGNAVIAGHRNYTFGQMFNRLGELEIGDIIHYQNKYGDQMYFEVFEIAVIEIGNQITFVQPINTSIITLYTCTPIRIASHRLIIRAQLLSERGTTNGN